MVNPLTRQNISNNSKFDESFEPVDHILNIDDLLLKNDDLHDQCDSARNLQSIAETET